MGNFRADCAGAATFGWIAGGSASKKAGQIKGFQNPEKSDLVEERVRFYSQFLARKTGPDWKEANLALQQIMGDYAGVNVRSETLLRAGLKYLRDLREKVFNTMTVDNGHTLVRTLETIDLMECGEIIFQSALERKETRGLHKRCDFPFTNPLLQDKWITIRKENGKPKIGWRDKN